MTLRYFLFFLLLSASSFGQNYRIIDRNAIGWYVYNGDHKLSKRWELHTEYQWRRVELIQSWQQSLARIGLGYKLSDQVKLAGGYTFFTTYPYGDFPVADANPRHIESWEYQNRARYQISGTIPLQGATIDDGEWYANFFDELFIGFGRQVEQNVFNQNRISGGLGYQFRDAFKIELNYLNQITQHPELEPITQKPVFEINNGFRLNVKYDLDFSKK